MMKALISVFTFLLLAAGVHYWTKAQVFDCMTADTMRGKYDVLTDDTLLKNKASLLQMLPELAVDTAQRKIYACALHAIGAIYAGASAPKFDSAIHFMELALQVRLQMKKQGMDHDDSTRMAATYYNLGKYHNELGDFYIAKAPCESAVLLYQQLNDVFLSSAIRQYADVLEHLGDFERSLEQYQEAVRVAKDGEQMAPALCGVASSLDFLGRADEAVAILKKIEKDTMIAKNEFFVYQNLGLSYEQLGKAELAVDYYQKAKVYVSTYDDALNILNSLGTSNRKAGRLGPAKAALNELKILAQQKNNTEYLAAYFDNYGEVLLVENRPDLARDYFRKAQDVLLSGNSAVYYAKNSLKQVGNKPDLFTQLFDEGRACCRIPGAEAEAIAAFSRADSVLQYMRYEHPFEGSKLAWRKKTAALYEAALEVCYRKQNIEQALYFFEKSKSVLLKDALAALNVASIIGKAQDSLLTVLQSRLNDCRKAYNRSPEEKGILDNLFQVQGQMDTVLAKLEREYPEFYRTRYQSTVMDLNTVSGHLPDEKTAFLQYYWGDTAFYALRVAKNQKNVLLMRPVSAQLRLDLEQFQAHCKGTNKIPPAAFAAAAYRIYQQILEPLVNVENGGFQTVIVSPHGPLAMLPFDALLTRPPQPGLIDYNTLPWLVNSMQCRMAWSGSVLWGYQAKSYPDMQAKAAVFVPESFKGLNPLLNSKVLLAHLKEILASAALAPFYQEKANRSAFESALRDKYAVYHLHTHAQASIGSEPSFELHDGPVYMEALYQTPIHTDLFILDCCETYAGTTAAGEGVLSLSRAITCAGARSVIASFWNVPEVSSVALFKYFYEALESGATKAEALQMAKIKYIKNHPSEEANPTNWAGFTFSGDDSPVALARNTLLFYAGITFITALALGWLWRYRNKTPREVL